MTHTSIRNVKTKSKKVYWFCIWTVRTVPFMLIEKRSEVKIKDLPEDVKKAITDYVEAILLAADHDCLYLYEQGAKDCVELLKKLGVL